jgi:hypothetical protein
LGACAPHDLEPDEETVREMEEQAFDEVEGERDERILNLGGESQVSLSDPDTGDPFVRTTAGSARVRYVETADDEFLQAQLQQVEGEIYEDGDLASRFRGEEGELDQGRQRLELREDVRVVSVESEEIEQELTLSADRIVYQEENGYISAEGNVTVESDQFVFGPVPELLATPDLRLFGTPEEFEEAWQERQE